MKFELRPYQKEALAAFLKAGKGLLKIHPGGGKTIIAAAAVEAIGFQRLRSGAGRLKTLALVPTIDLVNQWERVMKEHSIPNVTVITYAKAVRPEVAQDEAFWAQYGLVVFDEAHHMAEGPVYQRLLLRAYKVPYALGLSSTPPAKADHVLLRVLPILYEQTFATGLEQGFAAPVEIRPVAIALTDEERAHYAAMTESIQSMVARYSDGGRDMNRVFTIAGPTMTARKKLVTMAKAKFEKLVEVIKDINATDKPKRIFMWTEYVDALEEAKRILLANGITAELVHGKTPKKQRVAVFQEWGTRFQVLLIAKIGEEGLDYPEVVHGVILAGARTSRQNVQRIGRLVRPQPGKVAKLTLIFAEGTFDEKLLNLIDQVTE
jgi:superfamily II DNA or RNA helicase